MKKRVLIIIVILVITLIGILIWLYTFRIIEEEQQCFDDSHCGFFYTKFEERPCSTCSYEDPDWICMNADKAKEKRIQLFNEGKIGSCVPCAEPYFDRHVCKCVNNKCIKTEKSEVI